MAIITNTPAPIGNLLQNMQQPQEENLGELITNLVINDSEDEMMEEQENEVAENEN